MTATMADQAILDGEPAAGGLARQPGAPEDRTSQELGSGTFVPEDVHRRRWAILAVLCLSLVLIVMDNTILNVALPSLVNDLGATNSQLQWIVDSYVLVFAGLLLTAGALGDRFGRKGALTVGLVDLRPRLGGVDAGRLVLGPHRRPGRSWASAAPSSCRRRSRSSPTCSAIPKERARAIAIWAGCAGLGVAIGPVVGGLLLEHYSWHSVFLINVPVIVLAVVAGWFLVPTSRDPNAPRIDIPGAALSIGGLVALVWSLIEAPRLRLDRPGDADRVRHRRGAPHRLHPLGAAHRPSDAGHAVLPQPPVQRGQLGHHARRSSPCSARSSCSRSTCSS